jgi:hypothetical protein
MRVLIAALLAGCTSVTLVVQPMPDSGSTPADLSRLDSASADMATLDLAAPEDMTGPARDLVTVPGPPDMWMCLGHQANCSAPGQCCSGGCEAIGGGSLECCEGLGGKCTTGYSCCGNDPDTGVALVCTTNVSGAIACCTKGTETCPTDASKKRDWRDCGGGKFYPGNCYL